MSERSAGDRPTIPTWAVWPHTETLDYAARQTVLDERLPALGLSTGDIAQICQVGKASVHLWHKNGLPRKNAVRSRETISRLGQLLDHLGQDLQLEDSSIRHFIRTEPMQMRHGVSASWHPGDFYWERGAYPLVLGLNLCGTSNFRTISCYEEIEGRILLRFPENFESYFGSLRLPEMPEETSSQEASKQITNS